MSNTEHVPVLLEEAVAVLDIKPDGCYLDATFGRGGHSKQILAHLNAGGRLYALDRDPQAAQEAAKMPQENFYFARLPFSQADKAFAEIGASSLDGALFDLGVSSPQLDTAERGFSFAKAGPLDMRMDPDSGMSAKEWLQQTDAQTLARAIRDLGGETHTVAKRIAAGVIQVRERLHTTLDLAQVVAELVPRKFHKAGYHPATQTFQAIRMMVNDEVGEIERGLAVVTNLLKPDGVLAVISFHGTEDAVVKRFIRSQEGEALPAEIPSKSGRVNQVLRLVNPVIKPSQEAIFFNPRCRSARLRKAVKL